MTAGATHAWPPTPPAASSPSSKPGTAPTPASRTGSKRSSRPGSAGPPSREFAINHVWLQLALTAADLTAADLIAWTQTTLLDGPLARAETKLLRYRLLHAAAQISRHSRRTVIKIAAGWPWARQLAAAFDRLAAIGQPTRC